MWTRAIDALWGMKIYNIMKFGVLFLSFKQAVGLSLWPLAQSKEDSFNTSVYNVIRSWMTSISQRKIGAASIALVGVIVYLLYFAGAVSFTIGM